MTPPRESQTALDRSAPPDAARTRRAVRAALARPDFYPEPVESVVVRETQLSWVFLAGDRAYKLSKPRVPAVLGSGGA